MSFIKKLVLIAMLFSSISYALPTDHESCRDKVMSDYTNLQKALFKGNEEDKVYLTATLQTLLNETGAYTLSMPLLTSAQLGNEPLYHEFLNRMNTEMDQTESGPFKAWLYGRMVLAAHSMQDHDTEKTVGTTLKSLLTQLINDDTTRLNRFTVWALAYESAVDKEYFTQVKTTMIEGANHLTDEFSNIVKSGETADKIQSARSDALWAWVMITQAAANSKDDEVYSKAIAQIRSITGQTSISAALSNGLKRTLASNDYPAWAIGIVRLAAQTIGDDPTSFEMADQLAISISEAKDGNYTYEALLAMVNSQLTIERGHELDHCSN